MRTWTRQTLRLLYRDKNLEITYRFALERYAFKNYLAILVPDARKLCRYSMMVPLVVLTIDNIEVSRIVWR